jgi:tetratricopeptide (TPR) repeat protein
MPSHTYYWIGRYEDAAKANMRAVELGVENAKRLGLGPPDGVWGLPYHGHNVTFGLGGALEAGDSDIALRLGRPLVERSQTNVKAGPGAQMIAALGYYALACFAGPAEVLALPEPKLPVLQAAWHYARGEAFARRNDPASVRQEAGAIRGITGELSTDDASMQAQTMTFIARNVLLGRAAMLEHRPQEAAVAFGQAAEMEEGSDFRSVADPPAWYYPVRRDLAAALLAANDATGARREAQAALQFRPRDPATLALLAQLGGAAPAR